MIIYFKYRFPTAASKGNWNYKYLKTDDLREGLFYAKELIEEDDDRNDTFRGYEYEFNVTPPLEILNRDLNEIYNNLNQYKNLEKEYQEYYDNTRIFFENSSRNSK